MRIIVEPSNPSTDDQVQLVFQGSGCIVETSQVRQASSFAFEVVHHNGCFATPPGYQFSWDVGQLSVGQYEVTLSERSIGGEEPFAQISESFTVTQGKFVQPIPVLSLPAIALLAVVIAWAARRALSPR